MSRLYKRSAKLQIIKPEGFFFFGNQNTIEITDLHITFTVEKELGKEPNAAEINISNLAAITRAELQKKPLHARLAVGYDGDQERVFAGDVFFVQSKREAADWVTRLQCGDGYRAFNFARSRKSFKGGVTRGDLLRQLANDMGIKVPTNATEAKEFTQQLVTGMALDGPSHRAMDRVVGPTGKEWSIQDGNLQILGDNEARAGVAEVISQDTGMIGSPEFGTPVDRKKRPTLNVTTLLNPRVMPGGRIFVQSENIEGIFKVIKVRHSGDTRGPEWKTTIEAKDAAGAKLV